LIIEIITDLIWLSINYQFIINFIKDDYYICFCHCQSQFIPTSTDEIWIFLTLCISDSRLLWVVGCLVTSSPCEQCNEMASIRPVAAYSCS